ncbi:MAG: LCP family protein [Candidatus Pacebacteria bacterium]|nr:LCP family protein [Candidatus Paceibacterota bacterium]
MKNYQKKLLVFLGIIVGGLILCSFLVFNSSRSNEYIFSYSKSSQAKTGEENEKPPLNILFLGVAGEGLRGSLLSDSIFIGHINFQKKQISFLSLPRDLWVKVPEKNLTTKINGIYALENEGKKISQAKNFNLIKKKVEEVTGLKIDQTIVFDLEGVEKLIDEIGGIDIWLEKDVYDPNFLNPYNSSQIFYLPAGWRHLDGATLVKFIRTRYAPEGDFYRIANQQQVVSALKNKLDQLTGVWNLITWFKIWQSLDGHYLTDLDFSTAWQILDSVKSINADNIKYLKISNRPPDQLLKSTTIIDETSGKEIYILIPAAGFENYEAIQKYLKEEINE